MIETEITDHDLEKLDPDDDDSPHARVSVTIGTSDGMGYGAAAVLFDGDLSPEAAATAIIATARGAARTYSPECAAALERLLRE